jgi:hypothetical protein
MTLENDIINQAVANVRQDVVSGFARALTPIDDDFRVELGGGHGLDSVDAVVAANDAVVAVPWTFPCVHTGEFLGIAPTYISFELRGTTFVDARGAADNWEYHRFVDYLGALHAIGVSTISRPVLTPDEYENWETQMRAQAGG